MVRILTQWRTALQYPIQSFQLSVIIFDTKLYLAHCQEFVKTMGTKENLFTFNKIHIAKGLRGLRRMKGYTLEELACWTGKDVGYLSRVENGKCVPKIKTLSDILSFYEMTIKDFYLKLDNLI